MTASPFAPSSPNQPGPARSTKRLDVLVADDDPATLVAVANAVRALGHRCRSARDGEEAWSMLQERRADVVVSDWEMFGVTGAELCKRVRAADNGAYTYFILMTGHHDREHLLEGMAAGADDYQKKPIELDELEARLVSAERVVALHRKLAARAADMQRDSTRLYAISRTDALTGAGNRLLMEEELAAAWARAHRYGHRYSLAIVDIDHFKEFNDGFGHLAGDEALRKLVAVLKKSMRAGDAIFRYGGEEFLVLLPEQGLDDAQLAIDRMRAEVEACAIRRPEPGKHLTISAGVAELDRTNEENVADWIARADAALYDAKTNGRNRTERR